MGRFVKKVAVHWDIRPKLEKREVILNYSQLRTKVNFAQVILGASEVLEVINSFRTPFSIPLVRMEQVGFSVRKRLTPLSIGGCGGR